MKAPTVAASRLLIWLVGDEKSALELSRGFDSFAQFMHDKNCCVHISVLDSSSSDLPEESADVVVAVPTLATWSRLRHSSAIGQPPLRSRAWPWGLSCLNDQHRERVEQANRCLTCFG